MCDVVSTAQLNLNAGDSVRVAFALIAGESLADITNSAQAAQIAYNTLTGVKENISSNGVSVTAVYPNPAKDVAEFNLQLEKTQQVEITVYDVLGNKVATLASGTQTAGNNHFVFNTKTWSKGVYVLNINGEYAKLNTKFVAGE